MGAPQRVTATHGVRAGNGSRRGALSDSRLATGDPACLARGAHAGDHGQALPDLQHLLFADAAGRGDGRGRGAIAP